ncbi:MAG: hypothetical protein FWC77_06690 [Defluviitaleaceae bacterium]|nr:hypothetical protein [Defluviitaleaceae bacterium]
MIRITEVSVYNFENALRGARNPMNSWHRTDSYYNDTGQYILGENDLGLAVKLCKAGSDHRKFMRQIIVSVDILAPLYWWKEFDTYKVGTTANSTSTMHKIHAKPFELDDFSHDRLTGSGKEALLNMIKILESARENFNSTKDKSEWYSIIQLLPSGYNQLRTCTMSYENLCSMYHARKTHKLHEWREFCGWVETLPYAKQLICGEV